ncbi:MAG: hypothetical protein GX070_09585 [Alcaligenaceae bacterium]|nr:hypothetical protein [Alcaligenaceae bacterium]
METYLYRNFDDRVHKDNPFYINLALPCQKEENPEFYSRSGWLSEKGLKNGLPQIFKHYNPHSPLQYDLLILRHMACGSYVISQVKDGNTSNKIARFTDGHLTKARSAFKEQLNQSARETLMLI